jgi:O-antigen/teichoic acid export membrane protein
VTILAVLYEAASTEYLVRETARAPRRLGELLGDLLVVKLIAGVAVGVVAVVLGLALGFTGSELALSALIALVLGANAFTKPFRAGLQGVERMGVVSLLSIVNAVLSAAGMVVLVTAGHGIVTALAFSAGVSLALVPVSWFALKRHAPVSLSASWAGARTVVGEGLPFTAVTLLNTATSYADAIIIRLLLGLTETGQYGAAYRLFVVLQFLPAIYLDSVLRTISHLAHEAASAFRDFVERSAAGLFVIALPLAAGGVVLAEPIVDLVFGDAYADAVPVFRVLLVSLPLSFPAWLLLPAIVVGKHTGAAGWILAGALGANIAANVVLVPIAGIEASAWITVATDAAIVIASTAVLARHGVTLRWLRLGAPAVPGAALVALTAFALRDLPLAVPVVTAALVYAVALKLAGFPERLGAGSLRGLLAGRA